MRLLFASRAAVKSWEAMLEVVCRCRGRQKGLQDVARRLLASLDNCGMFVCAGNEAEACGEG
jgi:hypothetical protein